MRGSRLQRLTAMAAAIAVLMVTYVFVRPQPVLAAAGSADSGIDSMFNYYGDNASCADWSGGDATNSIVLPNGARAWFFSDTYLGSPANRKTLFYASSLHNSVVIQNGGPPASGPPTMRTITGGNTCQEQNMSLSFWDRYAKTPAPAPDGSSGGFFWTGDQMIVGSNVVKFYYHGTHNVVPFAIDGSAVATIPVSSLESNTTMTINPLQFTQLCADGPTSIIWGASLLNWGGYVYIYGWSTTNRGLLYLARTTSDNLTNPAAWQTFNGLSGGSPVWSSCGNVSPLPISLGSGFSVASINGSLWLIQMDQSSSLAAGPVTAHPASQPWLFGNNEVVLYYPPEGHHDYPYYYLGYEARLQPGLSGSNTYVVISYNVNTTAVDTGCVSANAHAASIYRPRFVDVPTSAFSVSNATSTGTTSGVQLAAPSYGIMDAGPTSTFASPATNADGTVLSPDASSGAKIDGASDWYDQWGSLNGGCPFIASPHQPSATTRPDGTVDLAWNGVGTDVWYYGYQCDATATTCDTNFSKMWGGLWETGPSGVAQPIDSSSVNGHTFAFYIRSFGAGNGPGGGNSPIVTTPVRMAVPSAPTSLTATSDGAGGFFLSWQPVSFGSPVYYAVSYLDMACNGGLSWCNTTCSGNSCYPVPWRTGYMTSTTFDLTGLTAGHQYMVYVTAANLAGTSAPSNPVYVGGGTSISQGWQQVGTFLADKWTDWIWESLNTGPGCDILGIEYCDEEIQFHVSGGTILQKTDSNGVVYQTYVASADRYQIRYCSGYCSSVFTYNEPVPLPSACQVLAYGVATGCDPNSGRLYFWDLSST